MNQVKITVLEIQCQPAIAVKCCLPCREFRFDTFANCVIVMVYNDVGEIVLCRQGYLSDRYWSFTSGYITGGESAEEAAVREVKEELGIRVQKLQYVGSYWFAQNDMLMSGYVAYTPKCDLNLSAEVDEAEWVRAEDAPQRFFPEAPGNAMWPLYRYYLENVKDRLM